MENKYLTVYKISLGNVLTYRFNFFLGRLRSIALLVLLYYVWMALSHKKGSFAGYTANELATYVFLVTIMKSIIFGPHMSRLAEEINDGTFSKYLCMPIKFPLFVFFRTLAKRTIYFISAIVEVSIFYFILKANLFFQTDWKYFIYFIISLILAYFMYFIMVFCIGLLAFWSRESHGPYFLFTWIAEFTSGEFYPLNILSPALFSFLTFLPFAHILFYPIMIYLGRLMTYEIIKIFAIQIIWILIISVLTLFVWKKGLRKYSGEGM